MVMYPHLATINVLLEAVRDQDGNWSNRDSDGNWGNTETDQTISVACRLVPNSGNKFLSLSDGTRIDYSASLYMPLGVNVPAGSKIKVEHKGITLIETTVKHFFQTRLNQKAWL